MRFVLGGYELTFRKIPIPRPPYVHPTAGTTKKPKKAEPTPRKQKCIYKDKVCYTREEAAKAAERIKASNPQIRIYCCEFCQNWHLTHKKKNPWA